MDEMKKRGATPNKSLFRRIAESEFFHNYKRSPSAIVGTVIVVLVLFIALFGPLFAPQNPYDVASLSLTDSYKPPAWEAGGDARFIFGTDSQGRDIFSSLIYGSRISLFIGVVGTLLACAVGILRDFLIPSPEWERSKNAWSPFRVWSPVCWICPKDVTSLPDANTARIFAVP